MSQQQEKLSNSATRPTSSSYVAGFMFSFDFSLIALIRKKPKRQDQAWQTGLLNGIGGGIEPGERPHEAMAREFAEETGVQTDPGRWFHFCTIAGTQGGDWNVRFYACPGDVSELRSMEEEKIEVLNVADISLTRADMIENLRWLIPLAIDTLTGGCPRGAVVNYI